MKKLNIVSKRLNISKGKIKEGIKKGEIPFEMENGVYYVDEEVVKGWLYSVVYNPNLKPFPKIIKRILIETYKDFKVSTLTSKGDELLEIFERIHKGKNTLHIVECVKILKYILKYTYSFMNSEFIDYDELKNNTTNYYEKLYNYYYPQMVLNKTQRNVDKLIDCEHFILSHFIKTNYDIVGLGDELGFFYKNNMVS